MKKILALMMALVLGLAFTSCEKADDDIASKMVGKWLLYKAVDADGKDVTGEVGLKEANQYLIFNAGGKGAIRIEVESMNMEVPFEWTIEGNAVTITSSQLETDTVLNIVSVTSTELVLEQDGAKEYFKKV